MSNFFRARSACKRKYLNSKLPHHGTPAKISPFIVFLSESSKDFREQIMGERQYAFLYSFQFSLGYNRLDRYCTYSSADTCRKITA